MGKRERARGLLARLHGRPGLILVAPALLAVVLYLPTLGYDFVWDDHSFLVSNASIRNLGGAWRFLTDESTASVHRDSPGIYRPLRNVVWALEYAVWGPSPAGFHLGSVLLHGVNVALVGWLALILLGRSAAGSSQLPLGSVFGSLAAAGFFGLHPLASEAVCWIKANDDLLLVLFLLLGAARGARFGARLATATLTSEAVPRSATAREIAVMLLLSAGALLSKESGVVFPGIVLLSAWAGHDRNRPPGSAAFVRRGWPWVLAAAGIALDLGYLLLRSRVLGELGQVPVPLAEGAALFWTQLRATGRGLLLLVWPQQLLADYFDFPISSGPDLAGLLALGSCSLLIGTAACLAWRGRAHLYVLAVGWWLLVLLPVSNLVPTMQFFAERFLYPALAGAALLVASLVAWLVRERPARRWWVLVAVACVLGLLGVRTALRLAVWRGPISLFESVVEDAPGNVRGVQNWVRALFNSGRYREAVDAMERLRELSPKHPTLVDLSVDARILAAVEERLPGLIEHVERSPEDVAASLELGRLALRARYVGTARRMFESVRAQQPGDWRPVAGLAVAEALEGYEREARAYLDEARGLAAGAAVLREDGTPIDRWEAWVKRALRSAKLAGPAWRQRPWPPRP